MVRHFLGSDHFLKKPRSFIFQLPDENDQHQQFVSPALPIPKQQKTIIKKLIDFHCQSKQKQKEKRLRHT